MKSLIKLIKPGQEIVLGALRIWLTGEDLRLEPGFVYLVLHVAISVAGPTRLPCSPVGAKGFGVGEVVFVNGCDIVHQTCLGFYLWISFLEDRVEMGIASKVCNHLDHGIAYLDREETWNWGSRHIGPPWLPTRARLDCSLAIENAVGMHYYADRPSWYYAVVWRSRDLPDCQVDHVIEWGM